MSHTLDTEIMSKVDCNFGDNNSLTKIIASRPKFTTKKLTIKNLKSEIKLPENYKHLTWNKLYDAVTAIHESKPVTYSLEVLYQAVENMCNNGMAFYLYTNLTNLTKSYVVNCMAKFLDDFVDMNVFLDEWDKWWKLYCKQMIMVRSIFLYLDRTYVMTSPLILSIWDMGLDVLRVQLITETQLASRIVDSLLLMIRKERDGDVVDRNLLKSLFRMLIDLSIYTAAFEEQFIKISDKYYDTEADKLLQELNVPEYLKHVSKRLTEENQRIQHYLHSGTQRQLILSVEKQLLCKHKSDIIRKGLDNLLDANQTDDLYLLYDLFNRICPPAVDELCTSFSKYIKDRGTVIVLDPEKDTLMVQDLIDFKDKMDNFVTVCFRKNKRFYNALRMAFDNFVNQRANKPAEIIAKFIDSKLRTGNKESTAEELDRLLDKIMVLFRFVNSKDIFEAFYKKDLAKRLLLNKSACVDSEKNMVSKLKQECGAGFTSKLEGMFKDIELSKDLNVAFKQSIRPTAPLCIDLTVNVLTMGIWPTYKVMNINLPQVMIHYQQFYETFYKAVNKGRKLQWQPNLGYCLLKASFPNGNKELQVSLIQALVLLFFNETTELTYQEIQRGLNIPDIELCRTLQSLACGKVRVLLKTPSTKDVNDTDTFRYNAGFTNKYCRIKINQIQMKETVEEQKATETGVLQYRQHKIDAAIVRTMKTRKSLNHNHLVTEIITQLKFPITSVDIKKRIESLIDRDYMERDHKAPDMYKYIA